MLPFHMLAALPIRPSFGLDPIVPLFPSLFSVTSATAVLKSPRGPIDDSCTHTHQPHHFPLFPHPVNMAHTEASANPSPSIIYFTLLCIPGGGGPSSPIPSHSHPVPLLSSAP